MVAQLTQPARWLHHNKFVTCLFIALYILTAHYSVSHTHSHVDCLPESVNSEFNELNSLLSAAGQADNWHSDQHHHAGCQLLSTTASLSYVLSTSSTLFRPIDTPAEQPITKSATPTKRLTRAPPAIVV